jgi:proline dehydrogenase
VSPWWKEDMNPMRSLLLAGSRNAWLQRQATRSRFVKVAVRRFMPGETVDEALAAAVEQNRLGIAVTLTHLGENLRERFEADAVLAHYQDTLARITAGGIRGEVSIKPTQLGYDIDPELCTRHARTLAEAARVHASRLWIDMEGSDYTDATLKLYRRLRESHANVGVCLQAYLRRTRADLESLLPMGPAIRIVKGAYAEPPDKAFPDKRDVDDNFHWMVEQLWQPGPRANGAWATIGTHDRNLLNEMELLAKRMGVGAKDYEYALLYGIQRGEQLRLVKSGRNVRVLISYGSHWFPWYMRRLAERPANLLFVAKSMFAS